ncbi:hypothetical protein HanPSC8_Chr17g0789751 [Helianthus annuus]|nr:hypothetical protein HanPSC8_Chr17g0789751 [Helianthus annuus]
MKAELQDESFMHVRRYYMYNQKLYFSMLLNIAFFDEVNFHNLFILSTRL